MTGVWSTPRIIERGARDLMNLGFGISFSSKPGSLPTVVLVDRGDKQKGLLPAFGDVLPAATVLLID